ncbi:hydantoinase/oxoprolinase family protein [Oceaniglobus ichthyenteri]|uniref:hydantoinase/oxoprolinase family protein n=1 Tax=Oceaniglobus ichthyenteri TaxID=2136177 RepID=UPI000D363782|nr:hydantoinase/oxoprolinase family protein [Oceaniglobus ichthyenteri]
MKHLSADVGGTFTDIVLIDTETGAMSVEKVPSSAGKSTAIVAGIEHTLTEAGLAPGDVGLFVHGFTIATNALLTRSGAHTALIVTAGLRDVLEIGDQRRADIYSLTAPQRLALVPRSQVFEVNERTDAFGETVTALSDAEIARVVAEVAATNPEAVAISLMFAHHAPGHEQAMKSALTAALPGVPVYCSSDINRQIEEYPRTNTTAIAAYVGPAVGAYINDLERGLGDIGFTAPRLYMQSDGGVGTASAILDNPAKVLLSGPAGGVIGAAELGRAMGRGDIVTFDMGGTSADFSLIEGETPRPVPAREVAGEPLRVPSLDIETISSGGGSIAAVDVGGALTVGPQSAGAVPGPASYGKGGTLPTLTDATVVLGIIGSSGALAGGLEMDVAAARTAVETHVAGPLGLTVEQAALGIVELSAAQMVEAVKSLSLARGCDVRDFSLMAFGGAGPVMAPFIARALGMRDIIVPPRPGVFAANGLLMCDVSYTGARPFAAPVADVSPDSIATALGEMRDELAQSLTRDHIAPGDQRFAFTADMRCIGQFHELSVDLNAPGTPDWWDGAAIAAAFHAAHKRVYGHADPSAEVEIVNLRCTATGVMPKAGFARRDDTTQGPAQPIGEGRMYLDHDSGFETCAIYDRAALCPGHRLSGPAIVMQSDTTTLILPGQTGTVCDLGVLTLTME